MTSARQAPTEHELRAGLLVARLLDREGSSVKAVRHAYRHALTGAEHPVESLVVGEKMLVGAGLLIPHEGDLFPTAALMVLAALDEGEALFALAAACGVDAVGVLPDLIAKHREQSQQLLDAYGAAGEEAVVDFCRRQLTSIGRAELAIGVQRISLLSDALGYDVAAPTTSSVLRHLEVKTRGGAGPTADFFLTRNEYEVGPRVRQQMVTGARADACLSRVSGSVS